MTELEKVAPSSLLSMQRDEVGYESDKEVCTVITIFTGQEYIHVSYVR
jgi:hypothetical protein